MFMHWPVSPIFSTSGYPSAMIHRHLNLFLGVMGSRVTPRRAFPRHICHCEGGSLALCHLGWFDQHWRGIPRRKLCCSICLTFTPSYSTLVETQIWVNSLVVCCTFQSLAMLITRVSGQKETLFFCPENPCGFSRNIGELCSTGE